MLGHAGSPPCLLPPARARAPAPGGSHLVPDHGDRLDLAEARRRPLRAGRRRPSRSVAAPTRTHPPARVYRRVSAAPPAHVHASHAPMPVGSSRACGRRAAKPRGAPSSRCSRRRRARRPFEGARASHPAGLPAASCRRARILAGRDSAVVAPLRRTAGMRLPRRDRGPVGPGRPGASGRVASPRPAAPGSRPHLPARLAEHDPGRRADPGRRGSRQIDQVLAHSGRCRWTSCRPRQGRPRSRVRVAGAEHGAASATSSGSSGTAVRPAKARVIQAVERSVAVRNTLQATAAGFRAPRTTP